MGMCKPAACRTRHDTCMLHCYFRNSNTACAARTAALSARWDAAAAQGQYLWCSMAMQINDARQERLVNLIAYTRFKPSLFNSDRRPEGTVATYAVLLSFSSTAEQFSLAQCSHASQTRKESATNAAPKPTTAALQPTKHRNTRGTCTTGEAMQVRCATVSLPHAR